MPRKVEESDFEVRLPRSKIETINASVESLRADKTRTSTQEFLNAPDTLLGSTSDDGSARTSAYRTKSGDIYTKAHSSAGRTQSGDSYTQVREKDTILRTASGNSANLTGSGHSAVSAQTSLAAPIVGTVEIDVERSEVEKGKPKTSQLGTFVNIFKGLMGTGILAMPDAVKNGGLVVGTAGILFLGLLATYCSHLLLHAYIQVSEGKPMSFSDVAKLAFRRAGKRAKKFDRTARYVVDVFLSLAQLGTCVCYNLAVARMIREVIEDAFPTLGWDIRIYETLLLPLLILSCFVRTLKVLSYIALFANIVQAAGLVIILQYVFRNLTAIENLNYVPPSLAAAPLFFGTAMFSFNIGPFLLPMETCMANRQAFHGWDGLLSFSMAFPIVLHAVVGFYGYQAFGSESKMILSNLPNGDWLYNIVKLMIALAIFLSYNLQLYVPVEVLYPGLKRRVNKPWFDRFGEYIFRTALVILTYALAVSIPCLELMISLVGALTSGSLNLIVPPLLALLCCFHQNGNKSLFTIVKSSVLIAFGIFGCGIGSLAAIMAMADAMSSPNGCGN